MGKGLYIGIGIALMISIVAVIGAAQDYRGSSALTCTQVVVIGNVDNKINSLKEQYGSDLRVGSTMPMGDGTTSLKYCYPKN